MQLKLLAACLSAALVVAACGKGEQKPAANSGNVSGPTTGASSAGAGSTTAPAQPQANTQTTPANIGQPTSAAEKREGANPQQQQVDPKEPAQHRDFQQKGDSAGPQSADTTPRSGN